MIAIKKEREILYDFFKINNIDLIITHNLFPEFNIAK